ncbi:glycoside hydrolase family 2 TIM barrel-domain containing protein [Cohnella sp. GCM10027633]|uniref:glycoside hydrolase family 2 TIM barrel-domain containing protein n=1 Tax=unclassified Cohnella TaxID=2636738 RepID=UPI0036440399
MATGRIIRNIHLNWKFHRGDEPRAWYKGYDDADWRGVTLPHDWSVEEPFSEAHSSGTGYLPGGTGWYRYRFALPSKLRGKRVSITFEGVYNNAQVWCNSYYQGKRPYGYSTFSYDITDFASFGDTDNYVVAVKVDHKDIADSRWFTGSGIYRNAYLTITDPIHIERYGVFVTTPDVSPERATVALSVRLSNCTAQDERVTIRHTLRDHDGRIVAATEEERDLTGGAEAAASDHALTVDEPKLWSPDTPYLYALSTKVLKDGELLDDVTTPVGIRSFSFDAHKGFCLNGANMKIKGVCVHHDAGALGAAVPEHVWVRRLEALKEMGCNAIRMSHNPPATNLLDLCDRMGFLVMDEAFDEWEGVKNKWSTGHNVYPPKHYGYYEDFPQWGEADIKEMVLRDRNHPSIILWSIGNEVDYPNDPYCHPYFRTMTGNNDANKPAAEREYDPNKPNAERLATIAKQLASYVKECDPTRPVTAAIAFPELSNLIGYTDALDVIGYNYKEHLYAEAREKYPDRVTYGSENGASLEAWLAVRDNDAICAQFIWTGIDYLGEAHGWPVRASQAGFLDLAGFKKSSYYFRKSLWSAEPTAFLAAAKADDPGLSGKGRWGGGDAHWNWNAGERLAVICYTNCEEAELFVNGRSLGAKRLAVSQLGYLVWEADFEEGTVRVVASNGDGVFRSHELHTASQPKKLELRADRVELLASGEDWAHVEIDIVDEAGRLVFAADQPIRVTVDGPGELMGLENGDAQDVEPYSSPVRRARHGKLLAFVRSRTEAGKITVRAEAPGLAGCSAEISVVPAHSD